MLVDVAASVISAGTERATLEAAEKNLLAKARARPDQARQVVDRVRRDGVRATVDFVRQRLDELGPLGYSAAGRVLEVGEDTTGLAPGDRVLALARNSAAFLLALFGALKRGVIFSTINTELKGAFLARTRSSRC